jgi:hypothetical protein
MSSLHPARVDSVGDLLTRKAGTVTLTAEEKTYGGVFHPTRSHPAAQDSMTSILHSVPPETLKAKEASGINSISHKRYLEQVSLRKKVTLFFCSVLQRPRETCGASRARSRASSGCPAAVNQGSVQE